MIQKYLVVVLGTFGLSLSAMAAEPNQAAGPYAGATYTYWKAKDDTGSIDKSGATLKAGYDFNQNWAVEGRINLTNYKETANSEELKVSTPVAVYAKYRYPVTPRIAPYAVAGSALNQFEYKSDEFDVSNDAVGLSAGLGAEITITPQLKGTVEYTYLGNNDNDGNDYDATGISAGLMYKF